MDVDGHTLSRQMGTSVDSLSWFGLSDFTGLNFGAKLLAESWALAASSDKDMQGFIPQLTFILMLTGLLT